MQVNSTSTAGAIIDMHPTVLNIGSKSTPEFIVDTAASVFGLPQGVITKAIEHVGTVMRIDNQTWWQHINEQYTANIQITAASVSNGSLSVTINNTGTQPVTLGTITVAPLGSECATPASTSQNHRAAPPCFTGAAVFLVQNDSSLKSFSSFILPNFFGGFGQRAARQQAVKQQLDVHHDLHHDLSIRSISREHRLHAGAGAECDPDLFREHKLRVRLRRQDRARGGIGRPVPDHRAGAGISRTDSSGGRLGHRLPPSLARYHRFITLF